MPKHFFNLSMFNDRRPAAAFLQNINTSLNFAPPKAKIIITSPNTLAVVELSMFRAIY